MTEVKKQYSERIQKSLMHILEVCEKEDAEARESLLREAKLHELYWHGFQHIFYDSNIGDFRIPTHETLQAIESDSDTKFVYDIVVNIFKAHGLSIIAALAAEIPGVHFSPENAESPDDLKAARQAEYLAKIISKQNRSKLLFYKALFTLFTNHIVASYNYYDRDRKFGELTLQKYKQELTKIEEDKYVCTVCEKEFEQNILKCDDCGGELEFVEGQSEMMAVPDGEETIGKGIERIDVEGDLTIKVPIYAADQDACGYLLQYKDQHYAFLRELHPDLDWDKLGPGGKQNSEKDARSYSTFRNYNNTKELLTYKRLWARPWMFNICDKEEALELKTEFPSGVRLCAIEDTFAEAIPDEMDKHWTLGKGDISRGVHGDPIARPLVPMQDLENSAVNLLTDSFEQSIPSTWASPEVVDFDLYGKQEATPGAINRIKNDISTNRKLDDYFYTLKPANLPAEGLEFERLVESKGQFLVGSFPSIYGGPQASGSKTLGEYQESRGYALQRLSIPYQLLWFWWADTLHKSVVDYIDNMLEDETHSMQAKSGHFQNVILYSDHFTNGKFHLLIPESAVDLPVSYSQKKSTLQTIVQLNNDYLNSFLFSPENRGVTLKYLGLEELTDSEFNQADKQISELYELLGSAGEIPIQVEAEIDDHEIHLRVGRNILCSDYGQRIKKFNPKGYEAALIHLSEHKMILDSMQLKKEVEPEVPEEEEVTS